MATVVPRLLPETQGVQFTVRPVLRTRESLMSGRSDKSSPIGSREAGRLVNPNMSSIEVETLLREHVHSKYDSLKQAFQTYDVDQNQSVTKGEFRRILESFCFPMSSEQFQSLIAKVDINPNHTVKYGDFLNKFHGKDVTHSHSEKQMNGRHRYALPSTPKEANMDIIEKMLREKICGNLKSIVKAMQLFDYNMDGKIQRHELRRVLENYCFKFTDQQFDKVWQRYDFHHSGTVNYKDFLHRLGISGQKPTLPAGAQSALTWPVRPPQPVVTSNRYLDKNVKTQIRKDEQMLQGLNFNQIELEFRKRMRANYLNLKKAFMSFDSHLNGFISIEDLKAILTNFTIPMSDQLFGQLMDRCGIKGTGRISWEAFLEKFQEPRDVGNGQTIPIKPNHKFFPIMETQAVVKADSIWNQLYEHVESHYPSFKQAFLEFDKNRDGKVTRKEFRRIIEKFAFHLEDAEFKKLMTAMDPQHTNDISYHDFLEVFEEKETLAGHKWLNSVHRFNDKPKPAILAWKTVEDLLREKITERWKSVAKAIVFYDRRAEGLMAPRNLKKIIDRHILPVSTEHFEHMLKRCAVHHDGKVNYIEFLENLNIDVAPGDLIGLSKQIIDGSDKAEFLRLEDHYKRSDLVDEHLSGRCSMMTAEEVISRLKDRMIQHDTEIRNTFLTYDKKRRGKVSKRVFREVLADFNILMTDEQFNVLVSKLDFNSGFMNYYDFIASFSDPQPTGLGEEIERTGNHRVNPIHGDEFGMSALEVESKLRAKLRENFADLRSAFYKFDDDHNGILNKSNFRRMLEAFMFVMTEEEYEKLCLRLGIDKKSCISYGQFLDCFEVRDSEEGHKWLHSVHMYNDTEPVPLQTAEQAHELLVTKAYNQWNDVTKAFLGMHNKSQGIITKQDLGLLLKKFLIPITNEEFKKLWARYDRENKGYISHQNFLENIGAEDYAPADVGVSEDIIGGSCKALIEHSKTQRIMHEQITLKQANLGTGMTAEWIEKQLREKMVEKFEDFYKAFQKYDTKKRGYLSVREIQKVLFNLNFFISDEEFFRLLDRIGLHTKKSQLNYEKFLKAFDDGRASRYGKRTKDVQIETYPNLSPEDAQTKLRDQLMAQSDAIGRAFAAFDRNQCGALPMADFRRILDMFCFQLTDAQWKHLKGMLRILVDGQVDYALFMEQFVSVELEDSTRWLMNKPQLMTIDEVQERLQESIQAHYVSLSNAFAELDYAQIGVVPKDQFRDTLNKFIFRLTDEQFENLWLTLPVNAFGNLNYHEFLLMYCDSNPNVTDSSRIVKSNVNHVSPRLPGRPQTSMSQRSLSRMDMSRPLTMQSRAMSRASTPLVNADSAEIKLKDVVFRKWKDIQYMCRKYDGENTGTISIYDFRDLMRQYGVHMSPEDFENIITKYDIHENGRFCYPDFLRHFILTLKTRENTDGSLLLRRKQPPNVMQTHTGDDLHLRNDARLRLKECVMQNWKEMRRELRKLDSLGTGTVRSIDFRQVLRQFNANLTEAEFFDLLYYYDTKVDGNISYNDFLRSYLK
ncbi:EF-hand calcium-binding domain-containing protein 6-like [Gigantopelta aegis]|uniref:EF-hand calcium-binding domain-containing protein 6-like n=1 Tax=Gigantopelta aegis TaxID=1735272 RepID=UPI001B88CA6F|nr:EF-hand calcium-binding domain-containing protein 6-like [Gigantopelta aegis]